MLRSLLAGHRGMAMAVRWNKRGDLLLSGAWMACCAVSWLGCGAISWLPLRSGSVPLRSQASAGMELRVQAQSEPEVWEISCRHFYPRDSTLPSWLSGPLPAGSLDGSLIVWDAKAGQQSKQYSHHGGPIVDADWRNNTMFASCSQARVLCVGPLLWLRLLGWVVCAVCGDRWRSNALFASCPQASSWGAYHHLGGVLDALCHLPSCLLLCKLHAAARCLPHAVA